MHFIDAMSKIDRMNDDLDSLQDTGMTDVALAGCTSCYTLYRMLFV